MHCDRYSSVEAEQLRLVFGSQNSTATLWLRLASFLHVLTGENIYVLMLL